MKILVFEYITGGGFNRQTLPHSLLSEGRMMLQALLANLSAINGIRVVLMLDSRAAGTLNTAGFETVIIKPAHNCHEEFAALARHCDAVWPIAPESDGILQALCEIVGLSGKKLLTSPAQAVAITGNKWTTYQHLKQHGIATVPTRLYSEETWDNQYLPSKTQQWLVKPVDGVGCSDSYIVSDPHDVANRHTRAGQAIIQPHIEGKKTSLSCLFKQGRGWLVCVNLQRFTIVNQQYQLSEIEVNVATDANRYQGLVDATAKALPTLWGYAGIDLIETPEQCLVLEINPRLTTSFVGIDAALGINVAENVLHLLTGKPALKTVCNQTITLKIQHY
jgi:predicted ATP-grasp superfamily ATP-dependent carboligase